MMLPFVLDRHTTGSLLTAEGALGQPVFVNVLAEATTASAAQSIGISINSTFATRPPKGK